MTDRIPHRFVDSLVGELWCIEALAADRLLAIATRAAVGEEFPRFAEPAAMAVRGDVALIPIDGPITRRTSLVSQNCGGSALERISADFDRALADPGVSRIELRVNSPGGEAAGIEQLANRIFAARRVKPISATIESLGASAAYWLAAAAERVTIAASASAGSVGAVVTAYRRGRDDGAVELVSSVSPKKRLDVGSDAGRAELQKMVDNLGAVFLDSVAMFRRVSRAHALERFGQGGLLHGSDAVSAGLVDSIDGGEMPALPRGGTTTAKALTLEQRWQSDAALRREFQFNFERFAAFENRVVR